MKYSTKNFGLCFYINECVFISLQAASLGRAPLTSRAPLLPAQDLVLVQQVEHPAAFLETLGAAPLQNRSLS